MRYQCLKLLELAVFNFLCAVPFLILEHVYLFSLQVL